MSYAWNHVYTRLCHYTSCTVVAAVKFDALDIESKNFNFKRSCKWFEEL